MKAAQFLLVCLAALPLTAASLTWAQEPPPRSVIALPSDGKATVIALIRHPTAWRTGDMPIFTVQADGTFIASGDGHGNSVHGKMSAEDLQGLLRFIVSDHRFFEFDDAAVQNELRRQNPCPINDASEAIIRITTAEHAREARTCELGLFVQPGHLYAIETRLLQLGATFKAGGAGAIDDALTRANAHLKQEFPDAPATLNRENLDYASRDTDGTRVIQFIHPWPGNNTIAISVQYGPGRDEVRVSVNNRVRVPPYLDR